MNFSETINKLKELSEPLNEAKGHLDHPEDLIFLSGSSGATRALGAIVQTAKNPKTVTIKWDGYPALIFGRDHTGKFSIMDKHMFNKKDGSGRTIYSPEEFRQYDLNRGVDRIGLHSLINEIWSGLASSSGSAHGYYWGDLLFSKPLEEKKGMFSFKANPNGITYTVNADSSIGELIDDKVAGIAVHQHIPPDAVTTDHAQPLHGTIGQLQNNSDVAIVPSAMPFTPKLKLDDTQVKRVQTSIQKYGQAVDLMMGNAPVAKGTFEQLFTVYINKKIVAGDLNNILDGFLVYFQSRPMSDEMLFRLSDYLHDNKVGLQGAFTIWVEIYKLKMHMVGQLNDAASDSPVKGYLQDGTETHEGFVSNGLKFVDRMGFSRQNLAGQR